MNRNLEAMLDEIVTARRMHASVGPEGLDRWAAMLREIVAAEESKWLSDERACRRSGKRLTWFRLHRQRWAEDGYARRVNGKWEYYEAVVPRRAGRAEPSDDPREQARRDAAA